MSDNLSPSQYANRKINKTENVLDKDELIEELSLKVMQLILEKSNLAEPEIEEDEEELEEDDE